MKKNIRASALKSRLPAALAAVCTISAGALSGVALEACDPGAFDSLRDAAGVLVADAPDGYARGGYGTVLASFNGTLGGVQVSRLTASADADSQLRVYAAWTGTALQMDPAAYDVCKDPGDCETGAGASLSGVSAWRGEALCVVTGAPNANLILVRCEESPTNAIERVTGPTGSLFGASVAGLPSGSVLVGAPGGGSGSGTIFLANATTGVSELVLTGARASGVSRIGAHMAVAPTATGGVIAAITATGGTVKRVIVVELDAAGTSTLLGCVDDANPGFGAVVAVGNLVGGDNVPDVVVGDDASQPARREAVRIYDGAALRAAGGACPAAVTPTIVTCADVRGVACMGSAYGAALAIGDVDGDGDGDLAIGAPEANFQGTNNAGAVWLVPGNGSTLETTGADLLAASDPVTSARLGTSVAMVETRRRSEVAAGAPGAAEVYLFACSGLTGDGVTAGPRCIPSM